MQAWAKWGAEILKSVGLGSHTGIIDDLNPKSTVLSDLLYQFCVVVNRHAVQVHCFFELLETDYGRKYGFSNVAKGMVQETSSWTS